MIEEFGETINETYLKHRLRDYEVIRKENEVENNLLTVRKDLGLKG